MTLGKREPDEQTKGTSRSPDGAACGGRRCFSPAIATGTAKSTGRVRSRDLLQIHCCQIDTILTHAVTVIGAYMQNMQTIRLMSHPLGAISSPLRHLFIITLLPARHSYNAMRMNHASIRWVI